MATVAFLTTAGALACGENAGPWPDGHSAVARNAVVVVVDTLRWDHVGAYGYERPVTPRLDALASSATVFERAYTPAPWTKPAFASLLTGLFPSRHGVKTLKRTLPEEHETLAERLRAVGFRTGAVISSLMLGRKLGSGLDQGFDEYREADPANLKSTPWVTDQALELLHGFDTSGDRFLLLVHYLDPHFDYLGHPEYGFAQLRAGRLDGSRKIRELRRMRDQLTDEEIAFLRDRYDEEIRFTDEGIGRLLDAIDLLGLSQDTLVAVTADHGEEFLERGWLGHTRTLYEELVRVPFLVRVPRAEQAAPPPRRITGAVSTVSLAPTLLDLLGVAAPADAFQAPSLAPLLLAGKGDATGPVFLEVDFEAESQHLEDISTYKKAVVDGRFKVVRDDVSGRVEVYDLEADPLEREDLSERDPELRRRLMKRLVEAIRLSRGS